MPSCVFRKCTNYQMKVNKAHDITYHAFPSNELRKVEWIAVVRKQRSEFDWTPSTSSKICSVHFKSEDKYKSKKGLTLLNKNAIPVIEEQECHNIPASPSSLDDVNIPELEEILETPKEAALRTCVNKLTFEKNVLRRKNKVLIQRNKRLKIKVARMADMLKTLKNKNIISKESEVVDLIN